MSVMAGPETAVVAAGAVGVTTASFSADTIWMAPASLVYVTVVSPSRASIRPILPENCGIAVTANVWLYIYYDKASKKNSPTTENNERVKRSVMLVAVTNAERKRTIMFVEIKYELSSVTI
jgi:hypothetical protein